MQIYALKRLWKLEVKQARQVKHTRRERRVLQACQSPFIITLKGTNQVQHAVAGLLTKRFAHSACQDDNSIYMLLELVQGGELWSLVYNEKCVARVPLVSVLRSCELTTCVFCVCVLCVFCVCVCCVCGCGVQVTSDAW